MVVIAMSGQPGCGSTTVAKLLAKRLKISFFSAGDFFKSHSSGNDSSKRAIDFWKTRWGSSKSFHNELDKAVVEKARKGNVVCDAKLSIHFLKGLADLKVRLKADMKTRARRYAKKDRVDISKARKYLLEKEKLENDNFLRIYGFSPDDQERDADLIIDTSGKSPEETAELIIAQIASSHKNKETIFKRNLKNRLQRL